MDHPHPPIYLSHRGETGHRSAQRLRASLVELFGEPVIDLGGDTGLESPPFDAGSVLLVLLTPDYAGEALDRSIDGAAGTRDPVRRHLQAAQAGRAHLLLLRIDQAPPLLAHGLPPELVSLAAQPSLTMRHAQWGEDLAALAQGLVELGFLPCDGGGRVRAPQGWRRSSLALALGGLLAGGGWLAYDAHLDRSEQHHLVMAQQAQFSVQPDLAQAREEYALALGARPDSPLAHYHLAHLLLRERDLPGARQHFAAALRSDRLPAARRVDANRLLQVLEPVDEPPPQQRDTALLAVRSPLVHGAGDGSFELPTEPTAAGLPAPPAARPAGRPPIEQVVAQAERAALAALRPPPSTDFRYAADAPALALLAGRVPPSSDQQREIDRQLDALYAADPQVRLTAASELLLTRDLHSDALPLAIERAEAQLLHHAGSAAVNDAAMLTLELLQDASPLTLVLHKNAVLRFVDAASLLGPAARARGEQLRERIASFTRLPQPVVYVQLADEVQRPFALHLATQLAEAGWLVPEFAVVGDSAAPERTEVRAQGGSHRGLARWMRRLTSEKTGQPADLEALREAQPSGDVYELWLDRDLCRRTGHRPAGCSG